MADNSNTLQLTLQIKDDGSVVIDTVKGKIQGLEQATAKAGSGTGSALSSLKTNWLALAGGVTAGYFAIKGGIDTITDLVNVAAEAEQIESRMAFQLSQVGYNFQEIKPYVDEFADSILRTTRFSDEMARQGLGQMMQYTPDVEQAMQGVKLAMDMSTQSGQDLGSTTRLVGMAMNGNAEILGRWIPELRDLESKVGANATAAEKWAYTQGILNKQFGGAAQKDLQTYAGQVAQLKNQYDEMKESGGRGLKPFAEDWVLGMKSILASGKLFDNDSLVGKTLNLIPGVAGINLLLGKMKEYREESEAAEKKYLEEAKSKAAEQALNARARRQYEIELSLKEDIHKLDVDYQAKYFQLANNKIGLIRLERDEALKAAQQKYAGIFTAETAIQKIRDYYLALEQKQIQENKKTQIDAMSSLAALWKGYYDERTQREKELVGLARMAGVETTIGAKFEFAGVEEEFRKISEMAKEKKMTAAELEKLYLAYGEKLQAILPFQGGEWEEISVPTGKEMGPEGLRTTWGTDYRWRETGMAEEQRQIESMREASRKRMEEEYKGGMSATGYQTPRDIINQFDEARDRTIELQKSIQEIQKIKLEVDSGKLVETIGEVKSLGRELSNLISRTWTIQVDINGQEIAQNIEQQLTDRWNNKRSIFRNAVEKE